MTDNYTTYNFSRIWGLSFEELSFFVELSNINSAGSGCSVEVFMCPWPIRIVMGSGS